MMETVMTFSPAYVHAADENPLVSYFLVNYHISHE